MDAGNDLSFDRALQAFVTTQQENQVLRGEVAALRETVERLGREAQAASRDDGVRDLAESIADRQYEVERAIRDQISTLQASLANLLVMFQQEQQNLIGGFTDFAERQLAGLRAESDAAISRLKATPRPAPTLSVVPPNPPAATPPAPPPYAPPPTQAYTPPFMAPPNGTPWPDAPRAEAKSLTERVRLVTPPPAYGRAADEAPLAVPTPIGPPPNVTGFERLQRQAADRPAEMRRPMTDGDTALAIEPTTVPDLPVYQPRVETAVDLPAVKPVATPVAAPVATPPVNAVASPADRPMKAVGAPADRPVTAPVPVVTSSSTSFVVPKSDSTVVMKAPVSMARPLTNGPASAVEARRGRGSATARVIVSPFPNFTALIRFETALKQIEAIRRFRSRNFRSGQFDMTFDYDPEVSVVDTLLGLPDYQLELVRSNDNSYVFNLLDANGAALRDA